MDVQGTIQFSVRYGSKYLSLFLTSLVRPTRIPDVIKVSSLSTGFILSACFVSILFGIGLQRQISTDLILEHSANDQVIYSVFIIGSWLLYSALCHLVCVWFKMNKVDYSSCLTIMLPVMSSLYLACSFFALLTHIALLGMEELGIIYRGYAHEKDRDTIFYWYFHVPLVVVNTTLVLKTLYGINSGARLIAFVPLNVILVLSFEFLGLLFWALGHGRGLRLIEKCSV